MDCSVAIGRGAVVACVLVSAAAGECRAQSLEMWRRACTTRFQGAAPVGNMLDSGAAMYFPGLGTGIFLPPSGCPAGTESQLEAPDGLGGGLVIGSGIAQNPAGGTIFIAGHAGTDGGHPVLWRINHLGTEPTSEVLSGLTPAGLGHALAVSSDGSIVVGESHNGSRLVPAKWTGQARSAAALAMPIGFVGGRAWTLSSDGLLAFGFAENAAGGKAPCRWVVATGVVERLPLPGGYSGGAVLGCSPSGLSAVGYVVDALTGDSVAARWKGGKVDVLGTLTPTSTSVAIAASSDESLVVGNDTSNGHVPHPFFWTKAGGIVNYFDYLHDNFGVPTDVLSATATGFVGGVAYVDFDYGGEILPTTALAGDFGYPGRAVAWFGRHCDADFNEDGFLDVFDYMAFIECFDAGVCPDDKTADFDRSDFVSFFDFDAFTLAWEHGCG